MKKTIKTIISCLLAVLCFAGCGKQEKPVPPSSEKVSYSDDVIVQDDSNYQDDDVVIEFFDKSE